MVDPAPLRHTPGWSTANEAARLCFGPSLLRRTVLTALVVGVLLSLVNQAHVVAGGRADAGTWLRVAANFAIPFVVSNVGALAATRRDHSERRRPG